MARKRRRLLSQVEAAKRTPSCSRTVLITRNVKPSELNESTTV